VSPVPDEPEDYRAIPRRAPRNRDRADGGGIDEVVAKSNAVAAKSAQRAAVLPKPESATREPVERLDIVLDKISKHGIESLTAEEQAILDEVSRRLRDNS
jgi:hypothetical protein